MSREDLSDARVMKMPEQLRLDLEAPLNGAREELATQHFEGDDAGRMLLVGEVHDAGAPRADLSDDHEVADDRAGALRRAVDRTRAAPLGRRQEGLGQVQHREEPLDFGPERRVAAASHLEERPALLDRHGGQRQKESTSRDRWAACRSRASVVSRPFVGAKRVVQPDAREGPLVLHGGR